MLSADEAFERLTVTRIGELDPVRGFSSFKFVPGSDDSLVSFMSVQQARERFQLFFFIA